MDGEVIIGTKLDTSGIDKGIDAVEKKLKKMYQKQVADVEYNEKTGLGTTTVRELTEEEQKYVDRLEATLLKLYEKRNAMLESQNIQQGITQELSEGNTEINKWVNGVYTTVDGKRLIKRTEEEITEEEKEQNRQTREHIANLDKIGISLKRVVKNVIRWSLAVFGIRSAYLAVRSAMNTLTQYDSQLKADIDYMKNAIAFALEPVVRKIVELMKTLMFYVAYIIKAWTGRDIFANANKSLKQANGEAKKLSKTMAGFDEMNVLSDSSSGGGGGVATPSFDLTAPEDIQPPAWLVWIADNKEIVIGGLLGIAGALVAVKLGLSGIMGLGIGIALTGLILLIRDVIDFIKDPSWDGFANILKDLAIILAGVAIAMLAVNAANPVAWIMLAIAAIALLVSAIIKNWDKIKAFLGNAVEWIKNTFNKVVEFFKNIISKIVTLFKDIGTKVGDAISGAFKNVINKVLSAIESILNKPIKTINSLIGTINKIPGINIGKLSTFSLPRLAKGGILNMPGKGINYGIANVAERGAEGVIPLTDSQQMALLGEAIGKYININATIPVYVANRQIAKEIRRINAEDDFAFNR